MIKRYLRRMVLPYTPNIERVKVIQTIVSKMNAAVYLEIGVDQGKVFEIVHGPYKIGVDPVSPFPKVLSVLDDKNIYIQKTSDDFFDQDASTILGGKKIDVAFIDGLHECHQVQRDIENTLNYLSDDGVILVHDCNPWSQAAAIRAYSFDEAREIAINEGYSDWDGGWTGDVWKAIVNLRSLRQDLDIFVLDCDCGIGVITKSKNSTPLLQLDGIDSMEYGDLDRNRYNYLNLKEPKYIYKFIETINN